MLLLAQQQSAPPEQVVSAVLFYGLAALAVLSVWAIVAATELSPLPAVGVLAMFVGIAFKLAAVPLHFWAPDVFEGAPTSVTTFLSVASKGAAVVLLLRVTQAFGQAAMLTGAQPFIGLATALAMVGAVTATWGNLAAFHQFNIKRLLAYSSIAHAGYMIMAAALGVAVPAICAAGILWTGILPGSGRNLVGDHAVIVSPRTAVTLDRVSPAQTRQSSPKVSADRS